MGAPAGAGHFRAGSLGAKPEFKATSAAPRRNDDISPKLRNDQAHYHCTAAVFIPGFRSSPRPSRVRARNHFLRPKTSAGNKSGSELAFTGTSMVEPQNAGHRHRFRNRNRLHRYRLHALEPSQIAAAFRAIAVEAASGIRDPQRHPGCWPHKSPISALPPIATRKRTTPNVREGPQTDLCTEHGGEAPVGGQRTAAQSIIAQGMLSSHPGNGGRLAHPQG
jgi:hypothetical protein